MKVYLILVVLLYSDRNISIVHYRPAESRHNAKTVTVKTVRSRIFVLTYGPIVVLS